MKRRVIARNASLMIVFVAVALTTFAENVRLVQILGLFFCGAVFGVGLVGIVDVFRSDRAKTEDASPGAS